jgi:hypothetical protein
LSEKSASGFPRLAFCPAKPFIGHHVAFIPASCILSENEPLLALATGEADNPTPGSDEL